MIATLLLSLIVGQPSPTQLHRRALWVWKASAIIHDSTKERLLFQFLEAPKGNTRNQITVLFLECNPTDLNGRGKLSSFLKEAHKRSLRVDYLCGEDNFATKAHMAEGVGHLAAVLKYNRLVGRESRFDGIQYDVEPYALPGWPKGSILTDYIEFLSRCRSKIADSQQELLFGAAIPRWYDGADLRGLYKKVIDRVDYVAVMDYVSEPDAFVADAINTVRYATKVGKAAWLGAEVSELPKEKTATFYALGNAKLEESFEAAEKAFGTEKGFAGVAVEWYDTYLTLKA